jgi:Kdo2-lipid IVA lauroyltransferase/acyltransferase
MKEKHSTKFCPSQQNAPKFRSSSARRASARFVIRVERVEIPRTADEAADAVAGTAALHAQFEAFIRRAPEQWMWAHRKWV